MLYLTLASLIWALSFGIIKSSLSDLNPILAATLRLLLATLSFTPFLKLSSIPLKISLRLLLIGSIQYGLLYLSYTYSFQFLDSYQVALFTLLTPLYVTLIDNIYQRSFNPLHALLALLAISGALIIKFHSIPTHNFLSGFLLVQISNISFAWGQIAYKKLRHNFPSLSDLNIYAIPFLGSFLLAALACSLSNNWSQLHSLSSSHLYALSYLGIISSGLACFLWNLGATKTNTPTLAVFNNIKVPLAVLSSLFLFNESTNIPRLLLGSSIILSALLVSHFLKPKPTP